MSHRSALHAAVVACVCGVAVMTRLAAAGPAWRMRDPARMLAQAPASSAISDTATIGGPVSAEELAKKPANPVASAADDPLPSWNDGAAKRTIVQFVADVTREGGPKFVPPAERIATFDNDGTLWAEQPMYFQFAFALERVKALAPQHPEWKEQEPFKSLLAGDLNGALAGGEPAIVQLVMATHAGVTTEEFEQIVKDWLATAKHPRFNRPYTECIYQPMVKLLAYLRANGFKTYIVSGGGVEFMRPWTGKAYGIPPEQVVGSTIKTKFERAPRGRADSGCRSSSSGRAWLSRTPRSTI